MQQWYSFCFFNWTEHCHIFSDITNASVLSALSNTGILKLHVQPFPKSNLECPRRVKMVDNFSMKANHYVTQSLPIDSYIEQNYSLSLWYGAVCPFALPYFCSLLRYLLAGMTNFTDVVHPICLMCSAGNEPGVSLDMCILIRLLILIFWSYFRPILNVEPSILVQSQHLTYHLAPVPSLR